MCSLLLRCNRESGCRQGLGRLKAISRSSHPLNGYGYLGLPRRSRLDSYLQEASLKNLLEDRDQEQEYSPRDVSEHIHKRAGMLDSFSQRRPCCSTVSRWPSVIPLDSCWHLGDHTAYMVVNVNSLVPGLPCAKHTQRSRSEAAETLEVPITSGPVFSILMLGPFATPVE